MINVSDEFRALMKKRTDFKCFAEVALADGDRLTFTDADFVASGNSLTDGAGASGLPLGAAVCRTVKLEVINTDGHLDGYDFFGARIRLYLTFALSQTKMERVELGTFTVSEPESAGETVTITAADDMILADKAYAPGVSGTVTLAALYRDVCDQCGLRYTTSTFSAGDMRVAVPEEEHTCREMLGYIAMLAAGIARVDRSGAVQIISYTKVGGESHYLTDWTQLSTDTDDVVITGLEVQTDDGTVMTGEEGYVLTVENPLMAGQEAAALERMGDVLLGLRLRRFDGSHVGYPLAECMDKVRLVDRRGREYISVITDVTFTFGGLTKLSNSAESVVRNGSRYVSPEVRARIEARKLVAKERSERERAIQALNKTLAEASGLYSTQEVQPDESVIYYLHDKPTIAESKNVMKLTADAIGFSVDGGKTYPFGFTVTGEMIMGVIQTEGLNADWVRFGALESQPDAEGNVNFSFDTETGRAVVRDLTIRGKNLAEALDGTVTSVEQEYIMSPSDTSPEEDPMAKWGPDIPAPIDGLYIWTRKKITYTDGSVGYTDVYCMSKNVGSIAQQVVDAQTQDDIVRKLTNDYQWQGLFFRDGYLYINAQYLRGETIDLSVLRLSGTICGIMEGFGAANIVEKTKGIVIYGNGLDVLGNAKPPYIIVTNGGIRGQSDDTHNFNMAGSEFEIVGNITAEIAKCLTVNVSDTLDVSNATIYGNTDLLWTGNMTSGSASLDADPDKYKFFLVTANPGGSGSSAVSCLIPSGRLGTKWQAADNQYYVSFTLTASRLTWNASNNNGVIHDVIGVK